MLIIVGLVVVVAAVIGGAAIGSLIVSTPKAVLLGIVAQIKGAMGTGTGKSDYVDLLSMLYAVFKQVQQGGVMSLEPHFENPAKSPLLTRYPKFLGRHEAVDFLADSVKIIIVGGIQSHDLEALMDEDLKAHHDEALKPASALTKIGDALPGLGIVAAVLGVVITMGHIDAPAAEVGAHIGAALVGTFLGILISYGFVQPLATSLEMRVNDDGYYCQCIKAGLLAVY